MADLYQDWLEHGAGAIEQVRERRPWDYIKVIAYLMPRDLHLRVNEFDEWSDDELRARIQQLDEVVRPFLRATDGGVR